MAPKEDNMLGDQRVAVPHEDADAAFRSLYAEHGPALQRQVLTEIYYRDRSVAETARLLRIPPGTVRSRTFYGLRALRRVLAAHDALS